jgi:hypothetical protein
MRDPHPTFAVVPNQRTYIHLTCGQATVITDEHFKGLCDPLTGWFGVSTYCTTCARQDRLERFYWADTKESLADYRRRIRATLPAGYLLKQRLVPLICALIVPAVCAYLAWRFVPKFHIAAGIGAFLIAAFIGLLAYGAFLGTDEIDFRKYR